MPRTILIGDVHGCRAELEELLDHVGFAFGDRLVMVGDLVVRGPDPAGVLDILQRTGARSVRGNHEDRLLRFRAGKLKALGATTRRTARALRRRHWSWLASLPHWIDLPEHGVRVVHAGLVPGVAIEDQDPRVLMYVRCLGRAGEPSETREEYGQVLWGERYQGPPHVAFGHNALVEPQIHAAATGLDTGCVYGGRLTAMVLRAGEEPPPPRSRLDVLVSVPARRAYVPRA
jgi:hypothetical protein